MTPMKIVAMTTEKKIEKSPLKTKREIKQSPKDQLWEWEDNIVKDGRDMTLQFSGLDQFWTGRFDKQSLFPGQGKHFSF